MKFLVLLSLLSLCFSHRSHTKVQHKSTTKEDDNKKSDDEALKALDAAFKKGEPYHVAVEGWLKLSSEMFGDASRYPPVPSPKGDNSMIHVEIIGPEQSNEERHVKGNFRKNTKYVEGSEDVPDADAFYFRLSGTNLYFTEKKDDMVVLGTMAIKNVGDVSNSNIHESCFKVESKEFDEWDLCAMTPAEKKIWFCGMHKALNQTCPLSDSNTRVDKIKIIKQPLILIPLPSPDCAKDWNYNLHGTDWICRCNEGIEQSPIDLPKVEALPLITYNALFDYNEVSKDDIKVIYNTNIIRIIPKNDEINLGTLTDVDGNMFKVREVQLHTPGDHTVRGKKIDLEVQIIHECMQGDFKEKAVVSFLYRKKAGAKVRFFEEFDILNLPNPLNPEAENVISSNFNIWKFIYDDEDLVQPPPFNYYKYRGSFTFPPCEENVNWYIKAEIMDLSMTTLTFIKDSIVAPKVFGEDCKDSDPDAMPENSDGNNRETQPLRDREIYYFDREKSCNPYEAPKKPPKTFGHFEKVEKKSAKYYFVGGDAPSGLPEAFMVSEREATGKLTPEMAINIGNYRQYDRFGIHRFKEAKLKNSKSNVFNIQNLHRFKEMTTAKRKFSKASQNYENPFILPPNYKHKKRNSKLSMKSKKHRKSTRQQFRK